jgi:hypothetical protein
MKHASKIGAGCYVLWGVLHAYIGAMLLSKALCKGTHDALAAVGNALPAERIPNANNAVTNAVLEHYAWNLIWFGVYAVVVAAWLNWRGSRVGYWSNLVVVSLTDIGFVAAIVLPGYITLAAGAPGPILWLLAAVFTTIGRFSGGRPSTHAATSHPV